ncbi:uncharacterized protein PSFLO_00044 [Pseudozyma flocculosa]|uniref:Uncharacterized protein n=1 Tax=Pseudozyma flocculosa TaxID=84751 RepID=A0A5C3EQJ8_9BASI|nr:uncharacterized protein PSFLO_00044 [Pseudozyma flocculosa]
MAPSLFAISPDTHVRQRKTTLARATNVTLAIRHRPPAVGGRSPCPRSRLDLWSPPKAYEATSGARWSKRRVYNVMPPSTCFDPHIPRPSTGVMVPAAVSLSQLIIASRGQPACTQPLRKACGQSADGAVVL